MKKDNLFYIRAVAANEEEGIIQDKYFWSGVALVLVWTMFSAAATWAVLEWWDL